MFIPERQREALMRLTMCARDECVMCIYQPKDDRCKGIATNAMNILANALEVDDGAPQTEEDSPLKINERFKAHCLNCVECGSYKCTKCDGEMYFKVDVPQMDSEVTRNSLRTDCTGCKFVGWYDTDFPCVNCVRKYKDYYDAEQAKVRTDE